MFKRLAMLIALGAILSGCFMVPMALVGPATSGFTSASLVQSGFTTGASYLVKKSTGKTPAEHAIDVINGEILKQTYLPNEKVNLNKTKGKNINFSIEDLIIAAQKDGKRILMEGKK